MLLFWLGMACIPLRFDVEGTVAYMYGDLTRSAPRKVERLFEKHPAVTLIHMEYCPGSLDDYAAFEASRLVRAQGVDTHVAADGEIASGGVDFFIAGVGRTVEPGGKVGVHSWAGGKVEGANLDRNHAEHTMYLDYYEEMGITEDFYWFTLEAASADDIHWMTQEELLTYGLIATTENRESTDGGATPSTQ